MDTVKVIVENWPETNLLQNNIPIIVAVCALAVSIFSACITRKAFIASNRPFVWAANYGQNSTLIPYKVGFSIINSPAIIKYLNISILLDNKSIYSHIDKNFVSVPDERNFWSFNIGETEFDKITNKSEAEKKPLIREITIKYSSFSGGKVYSFYLNYEKAAKLSPNDQDIIANLRFTQLNIIDRVPEPKRSFFENFLWYLHNMFSLSLQMWILFFLLLVMGIAFAFSLFASHNARLWLIYTISLCFIVSILFGSSIGLKIYNAEKKKFAIVLEKSADAKNAPNGDKILFTVHEGTKFQIRKTVDNWSLVNLPNGVSGWVENNLLGSI